MSEIFIEILVRLAIVPALFLTPWLFVRIILPNRQPLLRLAASGPACLLINMIIPVSMHLSGFPITPLRLAITHWLTFATVLLIFKAKSRKQKTEIQNPSFCVFRGSLRPFPNPKSLPLLAIFIFLVLLLFPYTHFTGIDTYKWQDLATSVRVEENIPWLAHPLSLLGFTARSYPSAQPLLLATIQILGGVGVEWGFYILSIWTAFAGFICAYVFATGIFTNRESIVSHRPPFCLPLLFALFYVLSPVFVRYSHWATGRGVFLAIYPLLLVAILYLPKLKAWLALLILLPLLATTHKVGLFAPMVLLLQSALSAVLPRRSNRLMVAAFGFPFLLAAFALVPSTYALPPAGNIFGLLRFSITRFGWMIPVAALGLLAPRNIFEKPTMRRLFPAILIAIPLAYEKQMYGALAALPFVVLAATLGLEWIWKTTFRTADSALRRPSCAMRVSFGFLLFIAVVPAIGTVIHRSLIATPEPVYKAAMFLEEHDPEGPFMIHAPGRARTQIQAYVSGCPRFNINSQNKSCMVFCQPPSLRGKPHHVIETWISFLRGIFAIPEITTDYYGRNPKHYFLEIHNNGTHPSDTEKIYDENGVRIYLQIP